MPGSEGRHKEKWRRLWPADNFTGEAQRKSFRQNATRSTLHCPFSSPRIVRPRPWAITIRPPPNPPTNRLCLVWGSVFSPFDSSLYFSLSPRLWRHKSFVFEFHPRASNPSTTTGLGSFAFRLQARHSYFLQISSPFIRDPGFSNISGGGRLEAEFTRNPTAFVRRGG